MTKKLMFTTGFALVLVLIFGALIINHKQTKLPTTVASAKAERPSNPSKCRADNTKGFKLASGEQQSIELTVLSQLIDVPAGTQADVHLYSYSPLKITGAVLYASDYGHYNYTIEKSGSKADWHFTEFTSCV